MVSAGRVVLRYLVASGDLPDLLRRYRERLAHYAAHEQKADLWLQAADKIEQLQKEGPHTKDEQEHLRSTHMHDVESRDSSGRPTSWREKSGPMTGAVENGGRSGEVGGAGKTLALAILQQLTLPTTLRKAVESSAKWWGKAVRGPRGESRAEKQRLGVQLYLEHLTIFRKYEKLYEDAIASGKQHSAEGEGATRLPAGPFTVVNTGGFDQDIMAECVKVVHKAAVAMQGIGLGKVLYGDVLISGKVMGKKDAAFYDPRQDEMFVRPNATDAAVRVICHELTHRLVAKFLQARIDEIDRIYATIKTQGMGFVTLYAKSGGPEENFCEMVGSHAIGRLPKEQFELIAPLLH